MSKKIISHFFEKNNLPIIRFYKTPFEHLIIDNCFNPILIKSILSEFKKNHKLFESKVMGGRLRLQNHDAGFKKFLKENNSSSKLYYFLKNFKNFQILYSYFKASLSKTFMNKDIRFYFDYSIGKKGYTREPHRDSNSRVIVFIGLMEVLILPGGPFILKLIPNNPSPTSFGITMSPITGIFDINLFKLFAGISVPLKLVIPLLS